LTYVLQGGMLHIPKWRSHHILRFYSCHASALLGGAKERQNGLQLL